MFSWLSERISAFSSLRTPEPGTEVERMMKEALEFEAVVSPARELEYKYLLDSICKASCNSDDRFAIMDFLHYSLSPANPAKEWRMIFNGLRILKALIDSGSVSIFREVSEGKHFDLVQKSLFLLTYCNADERVAKLIRVTAREIRDKLLEKFNDLENEPNVEKKSVSYRDAIKRPSVVAAPSSISHLVSLGHVEEDYPSRNEDDTPRPNVQETVDLLDLDDDCTVKVKNFTD